MTKQPSSEDLTRALRGLAPPRAAASAAASAASERFAEAAVADDLADVAFWTAASPVGDLLVAVTRGGLVRIAYADETRDEVLAHLAREVSPRILESASATDLVRRELEEYFAGERPRFDLKVDRQLIRGVAREVLAAIGRVPFGQTTTYGELAGRIGRPRAARAVGNALGSNPIPIVIPCNRVLRAGGLLGGYAGGLDRKQVLLQLEGALASP